MRETVENRLKDSRKIALKLMLEQLENTPYSLEREEYKDISQDEMESICNEIYKIKEQFKKRYSL